MKVIIYQRPDGGVSVVYPVINTVGEVDGMDEEKALERALKKLQEQIKSGEIKALNPLIVDQSSVPTDRTFRNAWCVEGGAIGHDMAKAREIHRGVLRQKRKPLLESLDTEYMRADEAGDTDKKKLIAAKKQKLRDATANPAIESAKTPEELKAVGLPE